MKIFSKEEDLPKLNPIGFKVIDVPKKTFELIQNVHNILKIDIEPERFAEPGNKGVLQNIENKHATDIMSVERLYPVGPDILNQLKDIHEEWAGQKLIPSSIYGIRSYKRNSFLKSHTDILETHHISSIIIVDKKVDEDWPLDIKDHEGNWHKIYADIGQMILYESAKCEHGRMTPLKGDYFRNLFVHYKLADWYFVY
jgi:hypothetical protein